MTVNEWVFIGLFFALGWTLPALPIVLGKFLAPQRPNAAKQETYECGVETFGPTWIQFRAQYLYFVLAFLVFDVELVFLFPFAVAFNGLGLFAVFEVTIFILLLVVALVYTRRKGALKWS